MEKTSKNLVIAVDGYSSCGKSSFAKRIAGELGITYIDSGAMYRAVTLWAIRNDAVSGGEVEIKKILKELNTLKIEFRKTGKSEETRLYLNGEDSEDEIRSMDVSSLVSPVSKVSGVRKRLVDLQRRMAENLSVIMDGRDIGTVVFPDANIKIFMTASLEIRGERRYKELKEKGIEVDFAEVLKNINERDEIDQSREHSPLKAADDSVILDNSHMTMGEQMSWFHETFKELIN